MTALLLHLVLLRRYAPCEPRVDVNDRTNETVNKAEFRRPFVRLTATGRFEVPTFLPA